MKMSKLALGLAVVMSVGSLTATAQAEEKSAALQAKQGVSFTGGAVAGAVLGGPIGMLAGAFLGAYVADNIEQAEQGKKLQLETVQLNKDKTAMTARLNELTTKLASADNYAEQQQAVIKEAFEVNLMFETGVATLSSNEQARVKKVATLLTAYPEFQVSLAGYADTRGDSEANLVLSRERAAEVADLLKRNGVASNQIVAVGYGERAGSGQSADELAFNRTVIMALTAPVESYLAEQ